MVDRYTKVVLTVIAMALLGIFVQGLVRPAIAQSNGCGSILEGCYIRTFNPIEVHVVR